MNLILFIFGILFIIFIINHQLSTQEGFNSYFRQTMRPHVRTIKGLQNMTIDQFMIQLSNIGGLFGISYN